MAALLLVLSGPPCAGKSSLAAALAAKLGIHWLHTDMMLSLLIPNSDRRKSDRDLAYRSTLATAKEFLKDSRSVLLDATYGSQEHRQAVEACAEALDVPLYLVQCRVSPELAVARFKSRGAHPATDLSEDRVRDLATRYRYFESGLILAAELPLADRLHRVEDYLLKGRPIGTDGSWSAVAQGYRA
jgi:predicted kinase